MNDIWTEAIAQLDEAIDRLNEAHKLIDDRDGKHGLLTWVGDARSAAKKVRDNLIITQHDLERELVKGWQTEDGGDL